MPSAGLKNKSGFTLIELLLVLALLGMLLAAAAPALSHHQGKRSLETAAQQLAVDIRRCRQMAVTTGDSHCIEFLINHSSYDYRIKNCLRIETERFKLTEGIKIRSTTFSISGISQLRFNPGGAPSSGGSVALQNSAGDRLYVVVTPATGRVRVTGDPP